MNIRELMKRLKEILVEVEDEVTPAEQVNLPDTDEMQTCSHDGCEGYAFDYYKDYPLCEVHYNEHIQLQKYMNQVMSSDSGE